MIDPHSLLALAHIMGPALDTIGSEAPPEPNGPAPGSDSDLPMLISMGMHFLPVGTLLDFLRLFHDSADVLAELFQVVAYGAASIDLSSGPAYFSGLSAIVSRPEWPSQAAELKRALEAGRAQSALLARGVAPGAPRPA